MRSETDIAGALSQRMNMPQIRDTVMRACGNPDNLTRLWDLARSDDRRTSVNALWAMTHLPESAEEWLSSLRDSMVDMLLTEPDISKKRMLLQILRDREYQPDDIRTDFLDFCMSKINSEHEPYAIRCFSIYTAFKMCRHYPELLDELKGHLDMMDLQPLSPGLRSALRQTRSKIAACRRKKTAKKYS